MKIFSVANLLKGIFIIPLGLAVIGVPYSLFIGWNLVSFALFWIVVIPVLALYLPSKVSRNRNHLLESISGLVIFYGFMAYMIYDHYQSDYFKLMIMSSIVNLLIITIASLTQKLKTVSSHWQPTQRSPPTPANAGSSHQFEK